jgi:hypothetical protein
MPGLRRHVPGRRAIKNSEQPLPDVAARASPPAGTAFRLEEPFGPYASGDPVDSPGTGVEAFHAKWGSLHKTTALFQGQGEEKGHPTRCVFCLLK